MVAPVNGPPTELWPLHPEQRRILRAQLWTPRSPKFNVGGYVRMHGPLDREAFGRALAWFWDNCDAERMAMVATDHEPLQQFRPDAAMPPMIEFDMRGRADGPATALSWMQGRMEEPLALTGFPLFEHALIAIGDDETWYFGRHHHIIADAYAFSLKINAVLDCYGILSAGGEAPAAKLGRYRDEIEAAIAYLRSPERLEELDYWAGRLAAAPPPLWPEAVSAGPGRAAPPREIEQVEVELCEAERAAILAVARAARGSAPHVLMACLAVHLARAAGRPELVIGVPVHNRANLRQKRTFGVMSAIVPTRLAVDPELTLTEAVRGVAIGLAEDMANRRVPLWDIVRQARAIEKSERPLFEIVVNYEPFLETRRAGGLSVTTHELSSRTEHIPLHVRLCDFGAHQPLTLRVQMMRGLHAGGAAAFAAQFGETLSRLLDRPDQPVHPSTGPIRMDISNDVCC